MKLAEHKICTGCAACYSACPQKAITMEIDKEGFSSPVINEQLCVDCGLCNAVCPEQVYKTFDIKSNKHDLLVFAAANLDERIRESSSSGGIFSALAECVIKQGGMVFGAGVTSSFMVKHSGISELDDIKKFRTSKYVQSNIGETFKECKYAVMSGRLVLYTGLPCQIAGLISYLGKTYDNLITVDLICSGCTSPLLWAQYVELLESKYNSRATEVNFRDKYYGWNYFSICVFFENGKHYRRIFPNDMWVRLFLDAEGMRECCYTCRYKQLHHVSDFTLGDFWGVQYEIPELFDDKGLSFVLLQSEKAKKIWRGLNTLRSREIDPSIVEKRNSAISEPAIRPAFREQFWLDYSRMGFEKCLQKYCKIPAWKKSNRLYLAYWFIRLYAGRIWRKYIRTRNND